VRKKTKRPPPEAHDPLTVDSDGAARMLGISSSHFYAMKRAGQLGPAPIRLGRCCRYRVDELHAWVAAGCPGATRWATMMREHDGI